LGANNSKKHHAQTSETAGAPRTEAALTTGIEMPEQNQRKHHQKRQRNSLNAINRRNDANSRVTKKAELFVRQFTRKSLKWRGYSRRSKLPRLEIVQWGVCPQFL
jgi:hypothetical protein